MLQNENGLALIMEDWENRKDENPAHYFRMIECKKLKDLPHTEDAENVSVANLCVLSNTERRRTFTLPWCW